MTAFGYTGISPIFYDGSTPEDGAIYNPTSGQWESPIQPAPTGDQGEPDADTNKANLDYAARFAMQSLNLSPLNQGDWTQAEMIAYITTFKNFILENPSYFNGATYSMAVQMNLDRPGYADNVTNVDVVADQADWVIKNLLEPAARIARPLTGVPEKITEAAGNMADALAKAAAAAAALPSALIAVVLIGGLLIWGLSASAPAIKGARSVFN